MLWAPANLIASLTSSGSLVIAVLKISFPGILNNNSDYNIYYSKTIIKFIEIYNKHYNDNKPNFKSNIIIVGHSLGGGLCKILGRLLGKQAISLIGLGINDFNFLELYK